MSSSRKTARNTPLMSRRGKGKAKEQDNRSGNVSGKLGKQTSLRSRSQSPKGSRSNSPQNKQHSILKKGNRSIQRKADELVDEDMETRSRRRKNNLVANEEPKTTSTLRSKQTAARTRLAVKKEHLNESADDKKTTTEPTVTFNDTPTHLYGLDNTNELSSGDESVNVTSADISTSCSPQKKFKEIRKYFTRQFRQMKNCKCLGIAVLIAFIAIAIVSALQVQFSQIDVPTVQFEEEKEAQELAEWQTKSLKELQEKLDQLSAQVTDSLKLIKEESNTALYNGSLTSKQHLAKYIDSLVKDKMEVVLDIYSADKLGIPDYALESSGGQIHGNHHSPTLNIGASRKLFGLSFWFDGVPPRAILQPENTPGSCWAFKGQEGYVVIELSQTVVPEMFTLEHIPASLSTEGDGKITNAPKEFSVWGWTDNQGSKRVCLGKFTYDNEGKSLQTFKVQDPNEQEFRFIELRVASNHGHPSHTCIYRFRVHGKPVDAKTSCDKS